MNKISMIMIVLVVAMTAQAKKTYVPRYTTVINIAALGTDTLTVANHNIEVVATPQSGLFSAAVYHDDMSLDKLKTIRRNKAAAGWAAFSATLSAFSAVMSNNFVDRAVALHNAQMAAILSALHSANAEVANVLGIELCIDNTSGKELVVNDMERGLTWYMLPHSTLQLRLSNPDIAQLRIADIKNEHPHYVTVGAGSEMKPMDVSYEDEDYVAVPIYERQDDGTKKKDFYNIINRRTWEQRSVSKEEFEEFKKSRK